MDRIMVAVAIGMGLVFCSGVITGILVMVAAAVRREDKRSTLTGRAPDAAARGVRRLTGVGMRDIVPPDPDRLRR